MKPFQISPNGSVGYYDLSYHTNRGITLQAHISDLHFGVIDPKVQFDILMDQFIKRIEGLPLDCISVDGDFFDRLVMSNTDAALYANLFFKELYNLCKRNRQNGVNTVLLILLGTKNHDADQLRLFYPYLKDTEVDLRIVEHIQFEWINGCRVLCIPELYGIPEEQYEQALFKSGQYDMVFMHGTIKGAVYDNHLGEAKIFDDVDFCNCLGPVIAGHVHTHQSLLGYCYYNGSPLRWCFGEEETKGFQLVLYDMDSRYSYVHLEPITSFIYETLSIDDIICRDPSKVIDYINNLKQERGIDYIRLKCKVNNDIENNLNIIKKYYQTDKTVKFLLEKDKGPDTKTFDEETRELYDHYRYLFDKSMSPYQIFAKFVNDSEGDIIVTADEIIDALRDI